MRKLLVVPGLFNECFASIALPFEVSMEHLRNRGFRIDQLVVSGRSSSDRNAVHITEVIGDQPTIKPAGKPPVFS